MTTRDKLLELFEKNKGRYFSGEEIAKELNVSRTAVWKAVKNLRNEGYEIDAITNKGYALSVKTDILSPQGIRKYLDNECNYMDINVLATTSSTNDVVKEKANSGYEEGYIVVANEQTKGKGRYGRAFYSPSGTGLYMSILLKPNNYDASGAVSITMIAAVAMCEAIEEVSDEKAEIKWVNDIYIKGKKVCGILTEGSYGLESGMLDYAVVGVGINVYYPKDGFPKEIDSIAGVIFNYTNEDSNIDSSGDLKNRLAASFINNFMKYYKSCSDDYIKEYKNKNFVVGKKVTVIIGGQKKEALVKGLDDKCRLVVEYEDGQNESLSYGEISLML